MTENEDLHDGRTAELGAKFDQDEAVTRGSDPRIENEKGAASAPKLTGRAYPEYLKQTILEKGGVTRRAAKRAASTSR